jgi:1-deoxy-D-xylulose-5-phosphate reductoisomerase
MTIRRSVTVLGSTGSIGVSTLDVLGRAMDAGSAEVEVKALTAARNVDLLAEQARRWRPDVAVVADEAAYPALKAALQGTGVEAAAGEAAVCQAAGAGEWVMAAIVGTAGLAPAMAAIRRGATVALANKESIVCAGPALLQAARESGGAVIPVDSEHSAIFQALQCGGLSRVSKLVLTASGGPFRTRSLEEMRRVTPEQAVAHPNWRMGVKNSVDSATLMNKGLEMIEASYLFDTPEHRIDVVIHPAVGDPQPGGVHRRLDYRPDEPARHAGPDRLRLRLAGPAELGRSQAGPGRNRCAHLRSPGPEAVSRSRPRTGRAARRRRGAGGLQRRQRGGGERLRGAADRVPRHRGHGRRDHGTCGIRTESRH